MIQLDPNSRYSAERYLTEWCGKAFPTYFYTFLHHYMSSISDKSDGLPPHGHVPSEVDDPLSQVLANLKSANRKKLSDADERIERIYHDFDKIAYFVSFHGDSDGNTSEENRRVVASSGRPVLVERRRTLSGMCI